MEYCHLGSSGLEVSRIGLGTIPFGTLIDEGECRRIADMFLEVGGNYIDTANIYGGGIRGDNSGAGISENIVGKVISGRRDKFVVGTKGGWLMEDFMRPNAFGLSRTYFTAQIEGSLRRLDTDYIDLYQCHVWDPYTPFEETMRVLDDFVKAGKIRYIGVSNWDGWHVVKANGITRQFNLSPIVSNQIWYNIADRVAEFSIIPACRNDNVSVIAWGALAQGFLTGRYRRGDRAPRPGARIAESKDSESSSWKNLAVERNWNTLENMDRIAKECQTSVPNVALAWLLQSGTCDVALLGPSKVEQFQDNLAGIALALSDEQMRELTKSSEPDHPYPNNFWDLFCFRGSEFYGGLR